MSPRDELREALVRMVILYENEMGGTDEPFTRPDWLNAALSPSSPVPEGIDWEEIETLRQDYRSRPTHSATRLIAAIDALKAQVQSGIQERNEDCARIWAQRDKDVSELREFIGQLDADLKAAQDGWEAEKKSAREEGQFLRDRLRDAKRAAYSNAARMVRDADDGIPLNCMADAIEARSEAENG